MIMSMTVPAQLPAPPDGMSIEEEREKIRADYPGIRKGSSQEISPELAHTYKYAMMARAYWKQQVELAQNLIRKEMRDAQTATVDGIPVAGRRITPYKEYTVPARDVDAIYPASKRT
jgi:hypothetical protein